MSLNNPIISAQAANDVVFNFTNSALGAYDTITNYASSFSRSAYTPVAGFRLSLSSTLPVSNADITGATTLYYHPYISNMFVDTTNGNTVGGWSATALSISLSGLTTGKNFDVFISGALAPALSLEEWTNDTTRNISLVNSGDLGAHYQHSSGNLTYIGTIRTSGTGTCEDSKAKRFVWNMYNRVPYHDYSHDDTNSWTNVGNGTWSAINSGNAAWKHEFVRGFDYDPMKVELAVYRTGLYVTSVALDSTTTPSANATRDMTSAGVSFNLRSSYAGLPGIGYHYLQGIQTTSTSATQTAYGDNNGNFIRSGFLVNGYR